MREEKLDEILFQISNLNQSLVSMQGIIDSSLSQSPKSSGSEILLSILPLVAITLGGVLFFFFLLWQYKLQKGLINSGQYKPNSVKSIRILSLLFGINGVLLGVPLILILFTVDGMGYSVLGGLIPLCLGLGMLIFYSVIRQYPQSD